MRLGSHAFVVFEEESLRRIGKKAGQLSRRAALPLDIPDAGPARPA